MKEPTIIAIASGKGGVGKSIFTANLAIALAQMGQKTIAVDLDLGGSNLHSYLGLPNKYPGLGDYLIAKVGRLQDYLVETGVANLQFLPGDGRTPCMADLTFSEKVRLLLALRWLQADVILLDLSGGSSSSTLDFFALAPSGIMITSLEYPSIMNMLVFLRNFVFRAFDRELKAYPGIAEVLMECRQVPMTQGQLTTQNILERISAKHPQAGEKARHLLTQFSTKIVYNFCLFPDQLKIGQQVDASAKNLVSLQVEHLGCVFEDRTAREATFRNLPLLPHYGQSVFAQGVIQIAKKLITPPSSSSLSAVALWQEAQVLSQQMAKVN